MIDCRNLIRIPHPSYEALPAHHSFCKHISNAGQGELCCTGQSTTAT